MTWAANRKIQCLKDQVISVEDDFPAPANWSGSSLSIHLMAEEDG